MDQLASSVCAFEAFAVWSKKEENKFAFENDHHVSTDVLPH